MELALTINIYIRIMGAYAIIQVHRPGAIFKLAVLINAYPPINKPAWI